MPHTLVNQGPSPSPDQLRVNRLLTQVASFLVAAGSGFVVTVNAYVESFSLANLGAVILVLLVLHLLMYPRFVFPREFVLYAGLVGYFTIQLAWTDDIALAMNTLVPAITFLLVLIQFAALATYHDARAMLAGTLGGFLVGMALYTRISGFPFVYPAGFSYNAIAGMYLIGLFVALLSSFYMRSKAPGLVVGAVFWLLIVATTSIKTNLGIALGIMAAGLMYSRHVGKVFGRTAVLLVALAGVVALALTANDALMKRLQEGSNRIAIGIEVLESRDDVQGYAAFDSRARWLSDGLAGWARNPVFGHGVEAFRARFGSTSHSTPVDLLYNSGIIGAGLFYGMFLSLAWRLLQSRDRSSNVVRAIVFGGLVCYLSVSLSGTMHYNPFLAVFMAVSTALLSRPRLRNSRDRVAAEPAQP
jgi:hypothetical protein